MRGRAMQSGRREPHLAHRIFFYARRPVSHAERCAPTAVRCGVEYLRPYGNRAF